MLAVAILIIVTIPAALASNILIVMPVPSRSHSHLFAPLVEELVKRGHNVTYLTCVPTSKKIPGLHQIVVPKKEVTLANGVQNFFEMRHMGPYKMAFFLPTMGAEVTEHFLKSKEFQGLLHSDSTFDTIIVEVYMSEAIAAGLSHKFKAPLIMYVTFMPSYWVHYMVGNEAPTSYIPDPLTCLPRSMNFFERLENFVFVNVAHIYHQLVHLRNQDALMRKYVDSELPYVADIIRNTSLLLSNDHFSISLPRPTVPNLISIGGVHVKPPKPLSRDLQTFMDESKNGVIFFSMGSHLKSSDMNSEKKDMFLNAFSRLKESIIWKFETDLPNKPKNVLISDWLPQSDLLAHPNVKLFITHGGLLSTTEATERGVPLVGIPIAGDQPMNMRQSVHSGVAVSLDYDKLDADSIYQAIREVIDNPRYKQAAQERSNQMKDKPISSMDLATYWVEYVIRHKGAHHLRSTVLDLHWYQAAQLDAIAFIAVFLYIIFTIIKRITLTCVRTICGGSTSKSNKQYKKKKE